jgi:transcriptional antiterminator Rof (Rho-off)
MPEPYRPIPCSFYDVLELAALKGQPVLLGFRQEDGREAEQEVRIVGLDTQGGAEFLRTADGLRLRLDAIAHLDGQRLSDGHCAR